MKFDITFYSRAENPAETTAPAEFVTLANTLARAMSDFMTTFGIESIDTGKVTYGVDNDIYTLNPRVMRISEASEAMPESMQIVQREIINSLAKMMDTMGIRRVTANTEADDVEKLKTSWKALNEISSKDK